MREKGGATNINLERVSEIFSFFSANLRWLELENFGQVFKSF